MIDVEKKIIAEIDWGKCPKCKSKMIYFMNNYQAGVPGEGGTYITYILKEDTTIKAICPNCKFQTELVHTICGICSKSYAIEHNYIGDNISLQNIDFSEIITSEVTKDDEDAE